jgi:hypothetical protein
MLKEISLIPFEIKLYRLQRTGPNFKIQKIYFKINFNILIFYITLITFYYEPFEIIKYNKQRIKKSVMRIFGKHDDCFFSSFFFFFFLHVHTRVGGGGFDLVTYAS